MKNQLKTLVHVHVCAKKIITLNSELQKVLQMVKTLERDSRKRKKRNQKKHKSLRLENTKNKDIDAGQLQIL